MIHDRVLRTAKVQVSRRRRDAQKEQKGQDPGDSDKSVEAGKEQKNNQTT